MMNKKEQNKFIMRWNMMMNLMDLYSQVGLYCSWWELPPRSWVSCENFCVTLNVIQLLQTGETSLLRGINEWFVFVEFEDK